MANEIKIEGLAQLNRMLQQLPANIERNILRGGLRAGQKVFQQLALANISPSMDDLRRSLKIKTSGRKGVASAVLSAGDRYAYYAHWVEYGTASYYEGTGRTVGAPYEITPRRYTALSFETKFSRRIIHPGVKPAPYMRPAADDGMEKALMAMRDYMKNRIEKEAMKVQR